MAIRSALVIYNNQNQILIEHALGKSKNTPHTWDLPKGHWDPEKDEQPIDVALRECEEETSLSFVRDDVELILETRYGSDTLYIFGLKEPIKLYEKDLDLLECTSLIDNSCSQKWKVGLPEVDDFELISSIQITYTNLTSRKL